MQILKLGHRQILRPRPPEHAHKVADGGSRRTLGHRESFGMHGMRHRINYRVQIRSVRPQSSRIMSPSRFGAPGSSLLPQSPPGATSNLKQV